MQKFRSVELLDQLQADVRQMILEVNRLKSLDPGLLLGQPAPGKWSVTQVLEHLNSYTRYYLLAIERALEADRPATGEFKPGWLGNYFTKLMKPGEDGEVKNKMNALKDHRPGRFEDALPVLTTFLEHQHYLVDLLEKAKAKNIGRIRVPISISKLIRLKAGDTFRFLIAHEQRHFVQIERTLAMLRGLSPNKYRATLPVM